MRFSGLRWRKVQALLCVASLAVVLASCQKTPTPSTKLEPVSRLRVCTQNLHRFSERRAGWSPEKQEKQKRYLLQRIERAACDIVALQEVVGRSKQEAESVTELLTAALTQRTGKPFRGIVGGTHDAFLSNAMVYRADIVKLERVVEFYRDPLPRLQYRRGATGHYSRGPLGVLFSLPPRSDGEQVRYVFPVTIHFKSKAGSFKDPSGTSFEKLRMEMAEGVRSSVLHTLASLPPRTIPIILGDRNADSASATAQILQGSIELEHFREGTCRLSKKLTPLCDEKELAEDSVPEFIGLFSTYGKEKGISVSSHVYRGKSSLIDEIYLYSRDIALARKADASLAVGQEGRFFKGSDHKLLWIELAWPQSTHTVVPQSTKPKTK